MPPVTPTDSVRNLATLEQLTRRLHTTGGGTGTDDVLLLGLLAASADRFRSLASDRTLYPIGDVDPFLRTLDVHAGNIVHLPDLRAVTSIDLEGFELAAGEYRLGYAVGDGPDLRYLRLHLGAWGYRATRFAPQITIAGAWGPSAVEARVNDAVLTWAARAYHARAARFSDAVQDPAGGVASHRAIPRDVGVVLEELQVAGL